jgi:NADH-quinone oxidoreductase subunit J
MTPIFALLAIFTIGSALAAITMRNLVHCALALALTFSGLAAFYLQLNAQFVGFAQILVYVGAVAILIVFAILLTRIGGEEGRGVFSSSWFFGAGIAGIVFALLVAMIRSSRVASSEHALVADPGVREIGNQLMTKYVLPLEVIGLLLTAALIGAAIIAMQEKPTK